MPHTASDPWFVFADPIVARLTGDDDLALWQVALNTILAATDAECGVYSGKDCIIAEIGRCSHWIRPYWRNGAGVAWPYGYGNVGQGFAFASLPQFDWSLKWLQDAETGEWKVVSGQPTRRPLVHRIAIPGRTARHQQATVHTIWTPGLPSDPKHKKTIVYGFEKSDVGWRLFSSWDRLHD